MKFDKFRFYMSNGHSYFMESDLKKILKNSKSITFNKNKFDGIKCFIRCSTAWQDYNLKEKINSKALKFTRRVARMYNYPIDISYDTSLPTGGTPYQKTSDKPIFGYNKYIGTDDIFGIVSIPAIRMIDKDRIRLNSFHRFCDIKCLKCNSIINEKNDYYCDDYTTYNLMNDRFECLCSNCNDSIGRDFINLGEDKMIGFIKNLID